MRTFFLKTFPLAFVFIFLIVACESENKLEAEIAEIDLDVTVERFDKLFAKSTPETLFELKTAYPFMFSKRYSDSVWIARTKDTLQQQLFEEVNKVYPDFLEEEDEINDLFKHLKFYNKTFSPPRVITVTSDVDYRNKVIVTDSIVLIALDTYLGADHMFYDNIQNYIKQNFRSSQIPVDLATKYAEKEIFQPKKKTFLDEMIYFGKQLYYKDIMIPLKTDAEKIGYTKSQLDWANANESNIWSNFVENEMLFSTDTKLLSRFINPAPFSKFYLELDNESPGRIGIYIGWQIVRSFMENTNVDFQEMLQMDAETIFNASKYKPKK